MECPVCSSQKTRIIHKKFPGYIEGTAYDIFDCPHCDSQFIDPGCYDAKLYETIYSQDDTPGYERYFRYAKEVKKSRDPLRFLAKEESTYYPVYRFLKGKAPGLRIIEVGCGYGYLTYALNKAGHQAIGIDLSKKAIKQARSDFGPHYHQSLLEEFKPEGKFDMVIATELVEHLHDPSRFISDSARLLKKGGKILLTTPNRGYFPKQAVWHTDLPPVHTLWLSKKSFRSLAIQAGLSCEFSDFRGYIANKENKLVNYLLSKANSTPSPILDREGKPFKKRVAEKGSVTRAVIRKVMFFPPVRDISHHIAYVLNPEHQTLGVILTKR